MTQYRSIILFTAVTILFTQLNSDAHEIVGEVTPLMMHIQNILSLIANDRANEAFHETEMVYEDFSHSMDMGMSMQGIGLKVTSADIDKRYNTNTGKILRESIKKREPNGLRKSLQSLAFLLMLEKFDVLQSNFGKTEVGIDVQKTIFWLGRNYFSYLLEPTLAKANPVEELRLDRMLDSMLYRLEDDKQGEFIETRMEFESGVIKVFNLGLTSLSYPKKSGTGK